MPGEDNGFHPSCKCSSQPRTIPVDDLNTPLAAELFSEQEISLRRRLATLYRIVDLFGWTQGIYNHITVRVSSDKKEFLLNPFGLHYNEITAGSLVKVTEDGSIVNDGSTRLGISKAGYMLHSAIHAARPEIQCVIHVHTPAGAAVAAHASGLLPISQEALIVGGVSYHDYRGIFIDDSEREEIAKDLGPKNMVMVLRNHGLVAMGRSVEEALHYLYNLMKSCETQVLAVNSGDARAGLTLPGKSISDQVFQTVTRGGGGVSSGSWGVGELEFEAHVRELERRGCNTGLMLRTTHLLDGGLCQDRTL